MRGDATSRLLGRRFCGPNLIDGRQRGARATKGGTRLRCHHHADRHMTDRQPLPQPRSPGHWVVLLALGVLLVFATCAQAREFEPNDRAPNASGPLRNGATLSATLGTENDEDWYFFYAPGSTQVQITVSQETGAPTDQRHPARGGICSLQEGIVVDLLEGPDATTDHLESVTPECDDSDTRFIPGRLRYSLSKGCYALYASRFGGLEGFDAIPYSLEVSSTAGLSAGQCPEFGTVKGVDPQPDADALAADRPPTPVVESLGVRLETAAGTYCWGGRCVDRPSPTTERALAVRPGGEVFVDMGYPAQTLDVQSPAGGTYASAVRLDAEGRRWSLRVPSSAAGEQEVSLRATYDRGDGFFTFRARVEPHPEPSQKEVGTAITAAVPPFKFVALGDSVTAAFGHRKDGTELPRTPSGDENKMGASIATCTGILGYSKDAAWPECQAPDQVAYPAIYAARKQITGAFRNYAVWGSTPEHWLAQGEVRDKEHLRYRLEEAIASRPNLTVLTLGANPPLQAFVTPALRGANRCWGNAEDRDDVARCAAKELDDENGDKKVEQGEDRTVEHLREIYRLLLVPDSERPVHRNHLVVMRYHFTKPTTLGGRLLRDWKMQALLDELNARVDEAASTVAATLADGTRLQVADADLPNERFKTHGCRDLAPWVIKADFCIHPSRAGHHSFANALSRIYPRPRDLALQL